MCLQNLILSDLGKKTNLNGIEYFISDHLKMYQAKTLVSNKCDIKILIKSFKIHL